MTLKGSISPHLYDFGDQLKFSLGNIAFSMTVPVSATSSSLFRPNGIPFHHFLCYLGQKSNGPGRRLILLEWFVVKMLYPYLR